MDGTRARVAPITRLVAQRQLRYGNPPTRDPLGNIAYAEATCPPSPPPPFHLLRGAARDAFRFAAVRAATFKKTHVAPATETMTRETFRGRENESLLFLEIGLPLTTLEMHRNQRVRTGTRRSCY